MDTFRGHLVGEMAKLALSKAQNLDDECGSNNESDYDPVSSPSSKEQAVADVPKDRALMNDGEVTFADLPREHFVVGEEVFCRRLPHYTANGGKGVHGVIQEITSNVKSPLLYKLEDTNPEYPWKTKSYQVEAADLIPIPKTGLGLPTFDVGTTVLVRYPATACLYQAEVLSYHDGTYVVEFQGDEEDRRTKVEKRFVVADLRPPVPRDAWANRDSDDAMLSVTPSTTGGTDAVPDTSHLFQTQQEDLHRYIGSAFQQQRSYSGWQASAEVELRVSQVKLLNDALLLIKPVVERARAVQVSLSFEHKAFRQSMSREAYERMCEEKVVQIHDMRRQQLNDGDTAHGLTKPPEMGPGSQSSYTATQPHMFDTTGQIAPPGMKPRVTATLWEDEGTVCFQVESNHVCVSRREDNHMINGTKLLNVAGLSRGRRDSILKSEQVRHIVKVGPTHLAGVWIPLERALDLANKHKITGSLYPLFVHNIGSLLYRPEAIPLQQ